MKKRILSIIVNIILGASTIILIYYLINLNKIETKLRYIVIILVISLVMLIISLTLIYSLKKKLRNNIAFVLLLVINIILAGGINFLNYNLYVFNKTLDNITSSFEKVKVSLVSFEKEEDLNNIKNKKIGIIDEDVSQNVHNLSISLINTLKYDNENIVYSDFYQLMDDLNNKVIDFAVLPTNYKEIYALYDNYLELANNLVVNASKENNKIINKDDNQNIVDITKPFTLLLIGVDTLSSSYNADTLMVITFNPETLTATMLSIPRDTYTTLANGAKHKINASGWSGDKSVVRTINKYLGINIDYYIKINFTGVVSLINSLGGIDVLVPYSFCEQNSKRNWGDDTVYVKKGWQHLNGEQALALTRNRHSPNDSYMMRKYCPQDKEGVRNDFTRGKNQQLVVKALMNSLKNVNDLDTVYKILDTLGKNINTNLSKENILSFYNLAKNIIDKTEGINLASAIKIERLAFTSYIQTIRIGNLNLSTVGNYGGSVDAVVTKMKENLGIKDKATIKNISFDINDKYVEKIVGSNIYTNKNAPVLMSNFVKKDINTLLNWAKENDFEVEITEKEINDNSYLNNTIISHTPQVYTDLSTVSSKKIKVVVAKNNNTNNSFNYKQCFDETFKNDSRCFLPDYTNKSIESFKIWLNKTGLTLNIKYEESVGNDNTITYQSIKNKSLYSIKSDNDEIIIKYNIKES